MIGEIAYKAIEDNRAKLVEVEKIFGKIPRAPIASLKLASGLPTS